MTVPWTIVRFDTIRLDALKLPEKEKWKRILSSKGARELEECVKETGVLQPPIVRDSDKMIIAGHRRIAGCFRAGLEEVNVCLVECSDEVADILTRAENAVREHDPRKKKEDLLDLLSRIERRAQTLREKDGKKAGRKVSDRGLARRELAEREGVSEHAIKMREHRAKAAEEKAREVDQEVALAKVSNPTVKTLGIGVNDPVWSQHVAKVQVYVDHVCHAIREAKKLVVAAMSDEVVRDDGRPEPLLIRREQWGRFLESLGAIDDQVKATRPYSLCPLCKGIEKAQSHCGFCGGTGWTSRLQEKQVGKEFLDEENPKVLYNGETVDAGDLLGGDQAGEDLL